MSKIGVFAGTFNPFTIGHLDILEQAESIFDEVIILVGNNMAKKNTTKIEGTSVSEGVVKIDVYATIERNFPSRKVEKWDQYLTNYMFEKEKEGHDVILVRGLRNYTDFDDEKKRLRYMQEMKPDLKVVYLMCSAKYEHVSSSDVRAMEEFKPGSGLKYIAREYETNKPNANPADF